MGRACLPHTIFPKVSTSAQRVITDAALVPDELCVIRISMVESFLHFQPILVIKVCTTAFGLFLF